MREKVVRILLQSGMKEKNVESSDFMTEGSLDSLKIMEIIAALEEKFHIVIDGNDIIPENFKNVDTIVAMVGAKGILCPRTDSYLNMSFYMKIRFSLLLQKTEKQMR